MCELKEKVCVDKAPNGVFYVQDRFWSYLVCFKFPGKRTRSWNTTLTQIEIFPKLWHELIDGAQPGLLVDISGRTKFNDLLPLAKVKFCLSLFKTLIRWKRRGKLGRLLQHKKNQDHG